MAQTPVLNEKEKYEYCENRLLGSVDGKILRPDDVLGFDLYLAMLASTVQKDKKNTKKIEQQNKREQLLFDDGFVIVPEASHIQRAERYISMIAAFKKLLGREIPFNIHERKNSSRITAIEYDNLGYDFSVGLFVPEKKYEDRRVFENNTVTDISDIIIGPCSEISKKAKIVEKGKNEYLDCQIVDIEGKRVLNLGYVYGAQGGMLIQKIMREYAALEKNNNKKREINIYVFGRVGSIKENMKIHDLVFPTGIINWANQLEDGDATVYPMRNIIAPKKEKLIQLNVPSVIDETYEQLSCARDFGCGIVEMENMDFISAVDLANRTFSKILKINYGMVGVVSDRPFNGDKINKELDSDKGMQNAVGIIYRRIAG